MTEIIHPSEARFSGPFLLDIDQLMKLDNILDTEFEALLSYREDLFKQELDLQIADYEKDGLNFKKDELEARIRDRSLFSNDKRQISVEFKSAKIAVGNHFSDIAENPDVRKEMPIAFEASFSRAGVSVSLSSRPYWADKAITLNIKPYNEITQSTWFKLERWISDASAPLWQKFWRKLATFDNIVQWIVLIIIIGFMLTFLPSQNANYSRSLGSYQNSIKSAAHQLLKRGIKQEDMIKAIEINLIITSDYLPDNIQVEPIKYPKWPFIIISITFILFLISLFPPRLHLGIGLGKASVVRWRRWLRILSFTIPSLVVVDIILPIIVNKIIL